MSEYYTFDESNNIVFLLYVLFYEDLSKHFGDSNDLSIQYDEILDRIKEDDNNYKIVSKIKNLIEENKIKVVSGDKNNITTAEVEPVSFFETLSQEGVKLSNDAIGSVRNAKKTRAEIKEKQERLSTFKKRTLQQTEFETLSNKEPLWDLSKAVLYVAGYKSFNEYKHDYECICSDDELKKIYDYARDSRKIRELDLVDGIGFGHPTQYQVRPKDFISWAKKRFVSSPFFEGNTANKNKPISYITPDMQLMFDAIENFWSGYDLSKPNPHVAPVKKDVVAWLINEADKRKINFSKTRAEHIDTIIRCPASRKGGNTY